MTLSGTFYDTIYFGDGTLSSGINPVRSNVTCSIPCDADSNSFTCETSNGVDPDATHRTSSLVYVAFSLDSKGFFLL